jgi:hypothetical protein
MNRPRKTPPRKLNPQAWRPAVQTLDAALARLPKTEDPYANWLLSQRIDRLRLALFGTIAH